MVGELGEGVLEEGLGEGRGKVQWAGAEDEAADEQGAAVLALLYELFGVLL